MKKELGKSMLLSSGSALALSLAVAGPLQANQNPFEVADLGSGYMQLAEAKCGGHKGAEMKCGEGQCGAAKAKDHKHKGDHECDHSKAGEMKCGEGKCGAKAMEMKCGEGKCGAAKAKEAKCGEAKCGEGAERSKGVRDQLIGK